MASIMFDSDNPAVLADPRCAHARVATYADLLTHQLVSVFAGRLVVIDRGRGDPLGLAHVADIEPELLTVAEGADKIRKWTQEGRQYITAYHDRSLSAEVAAAVAPLKPWNWVATLDGTLVPDGKYPAVVQFGDDRVTGFHADVSIVWNEAYKPQHAGPDGAALAHVQQLAQQAVAAAQAAAKAVLGL